jgi:hypothetical protein
MKLSWQNFPYVQPSRVPPLLTWDCNVMAAMPILEVPKDLDHTRILALFFETSWCSQFKAQAQSLPHLMTEITQPCVHTCDGLFICQLYLLPELLEGMDSNKDTSLTLPFVSFISLSQLIIVIWIKTSVGTTTVFHTGISRAVAVA